MKKLDDLDRLIIQATQGGLPLTRHPYQTVAEQLNLTSEEVMTRLKALLEQGIIRRIAAVPNHYQLGYRANGMSVWCVPDEYIDGLGKQVGALEFVSHCYRRPTYPPIWNYNLFAMIHAKTAEEVETKVQIISELLGRYDLGHEILYSTRILKKTGLRLL